MAGTFDIISLESSARAIAIVLASLAGILVFLKGKEYDTKFSFIDLHDSKKRIIGASIAYSAVYALVALVNYALNLL